MMRAVRRIFQSLCTATVDENCDGDTTIGATDVTVSYADSDGGMDRGMLVYGVRV